jgi:hypothetical protein
MQNLAKEHPEIVNRLSGYLARFEKELGKGDKLSVNCRPAGHVANPKPLVPARK